MASPSTTPAEGLRTLDPSAGVLFCGWCVAARPGNGFVSHDTITYLNSHSKRNTTEWKTSYGVR